MPAIASFLTANRQKLAGTLAIADVDVTRYAAMFLVGGSGAMFEFPSHVPLQMHIAAMAERGAVISAVCHGPAALRDVKLADGTYLIAGKRISAFTEEEEALFGAETAKTYPFVLEQALRARGAIFDEEPVMLVNVSRDGLLVTGQNPFSTPHTIDEVIRALGRIPKPREPDRNEATLLLIAEIRNDASSEAKLHAAPQRYNVKLLGMYGARLADSANDGELRHAVTLMKAASRHVTHPKLQSALDRASLRLRDCEINDDGDGKAARVTDRRSD
jgi:putative intracellular protease/amidase